MRVVLIALCLTGCAHQDGWRQQDSFMYATTATALALDAYTTSQIQYDPNLYEAGPARYALGDQPQTGDTVMYFTTLAVSYYLIGRAIPAEWRPYWFGTMTAMHGAAVITNCDNGLC